ncbi:RHS repeat-associated core domain-containing protein [Pseudomonas sp. NY11955]|uniref:RHS repeat-associated core domain-containing protein n=1 Tax=Pseudomonas sp. NY11955 TaxID=3400363 RepID=UPI003A85B140
MMQHASMAVNICRAVSYAPYGVQSCSSTSSLAFNGERQDRFTGNYLLGSRRAYSPALRRFLSADQLSPFSKGGINAYVYCLCDPVNRCDPSGAFSILSLLKRVVWLGARLKVAFSGPSKLKRMAEIAKWTAGVGGAMAAYEIPGSQALVTAGSIVSVGLKAASVSKALKKQVEKGPGPFLMDLSKAKFSPFVGPVASRSSNPVEAAVKIRAATRP